MRIVFTRLSDGVIVGSLTRKNDTLVATGAAIDLLKSAQGRNVENSAILKKYSQWTNGVFASRGV